MSYEIYCYKSQFGSPDIDEAHAVIEAGEESEVEKDPKTKTKIAEALIGYDPRLENFCFDYAEIAKFQNISIEEARKQFDHIELNTSEGELAIQFNIFDNNVCITIPYWYSNDKAEKAFIIVNEYLRIIRKTAGYLVYDPQTENAYDPLAKILMD